ncbi:hypothetical protein B0H16DRAFT_1468626 [Mycena metata]|uniref:Uncharacterized protein n=1 Tax=Mycena metata TaxID=1033252 RepID=A0AAD7I1Y8_9AGAR|nr:hypothetical protein B0H16DRAFT_1468626 [Mycena metata]
MPKATCNPYRKDVNSEDYIAHNSGTDEDDMNKSGAQDQDKQVEASAQLQHVWRDDDHSVTSTHMQPVKTKPDSEDLEADSEPQIPNDRGTGGNFIHRFFWGLHQGIETEIKNGCRSGLKLHCIQEEQKKSMLLQPWRYSSLTALLERIKPVNRRAEKSQCGYHVAVASAALYPGLAFDMDVKSKPQKLC